MSKSNLRVAVRLVLLFTLIFALSLTQGWASTIGSQLTALADLDGSSEVVVIYNGGSAAYFNPGDTIGNFSWIGKLFSGSAELTPLLFQSNGSGTFTLEGIGTAIAVNGASDVGSASFGLVAGSPVVGTGYTFGFVDGTVNSGGTVATSQGSVTFANASGALPTASGTGVNDWVFTPNTDSTFTLSVGTSTFGGSGNGTNPLNNAALNGFNVDRTYSAQANSNASGVAEPGTFSLITGAGLVLAGLFRYRYARGRRQS
jgi:hypothetical protein